MSMVMEARSSSSTSLQSFTPGPHRRSHPNLQHLSLAPLQPKYPITPSDYDAYVDPQTSSLHTSSSLSHLSSPATPPFQSLSSRSRSANPSSTRLNGQQKRTRKQQPLLQPLSITTHTAESTSLRIADIPLMTSPPNKSSASTPWFIQTGLTLTSSTAEFKGQTWLSKRESSTTLTSPSMTPPFRTPDAEPRGEYGFPTSMSRPHTPAPGRSRRASRSRGVSRRDLAMTPAAAAEKLICDHNSGGKNSWSASRRGSAVVFTEARSREREVKHPSVGDVPGGSRPDWADEGTKREAEREQRERDLVGENSEQGVDWRALDEEDEGVFEYGDVDGELNDTEKDHLGKSEEQHLREQVRSKGFGIGKWVDGWVDALLKVGEDQEEEGGDLGLEQRKKSPSREEQDGPDAKGRSTDLRKENERLESIGSSNVPEQAHRRPGDSPKDNAPQNPETMWEDVKWLGNLVWDTAIS